MKRVQIYLCHRYIGKRLKETEEDHFGIRVSGVSRASRRVALQHNGDKGLYKKINKLVIDLGLSLSIVQG